MTPERAAELANQYWDEWMNSPSRARLADALTLAILAACREQREQDATIAANMEPDDHGRLSVEDIAKAIRSAE